MIIWNAELYHSWGNSPKMKRLEKAYNAWYYKNHKEKWGVHTDKHGNTKIGSKKLSGKVIDLGPLKISRGKNGIQANLDVTDVTGRKKTKSKTETKKEETKKKSTKRKSKYKVSKPSSLKTSESTKDKKSAGSSGKGKGKTGGSEKGKKGSSGKGKKKSAKKAQASKSTPKKEVVDKYSYNYIYENGKLIKIDKKKSTVTTPSSKPKKSRRKRLKKTLNKKKSSITKKQVAKGKAKFNNRSK